MVDERKKKRLFDFADSQLPTDYHKLAEIEGVEMTLIAGHVGTGKFGEFAVLDLVDEKGETRTYMTSGFLVVDALRKALLADALPVQAIFTRKGQCWRIE